MAHRDHGGSHGEEATAIDRSTFVCNYDKPSRDVAFTLRFSRFRILCSITMITWRRGSTVSVEACFSSLGLAEGILHGQQTRTGNPNGKQIEASRKRSGGDGGSSETA